MSGSRERAGDRFMPEPQFVERHRIRIRANRAAVDAAVRRLDLGRSALVRALFRLRGMPAAALRLDVLERIGFIRIVDQPGDLVLGLIGRFWTPSGRIEPFAPADFAAFDRPGVARAVWSFSSESLGSGETLLETETRVQCTDEASRRSFARYWLVIRPFSGLIRRAALRSIRREAEGRPR